MITEVLIHLGADGSASDVSSSSDPKITLLQIYEDSSEIITLGKYSRFNADTYLRPHTIKKYT